LYSACHQPVGRGSGCPHHGRCFCNLYHDHEVVVVVVVVVVMVLHFHMDSNYVVTPAWFDNI